MTLDQIMAEMRQASRGFAAGGARAEQAAEALRALGRAAANVPMPPIQAIARFRLARLASEQGAARFVLPEYWRWKRLAISQPPISGE